uniref:Pyrin n=1 Tax=Pan troglodytes TaxID=9598 RepID=A0A2I3SZR8_PANTR
MAKTPSDHLLSTLEELVPYDFEKFKFKLQNTSVQKEHSRIPRSQIQRARPVKMATLLVTYYGEEYAVQLTLQVLRAINQRLLAEELHRAAIQEYSTQENGTDDSAASSSLGENKPRSLKTPDHPEGNEGNGPRPYGGGAASLRRSQPESGRGLSRKPLSKRRDKASEGLDAQGKPRTRSPALPGGRSPGPCRAPEGDQAEVRLRRNASSAGRLQGLAGGAPGRKECRPFEVYLPSGKMRPRSLEVTISTGEKAPANPEILLTLEETTAANLNSATEPRARPTPDGGASADLKEGPGNPEHSVTGRPPDTAASPRCHAQEGDPVGGTCVHDSCSFPEAVSGHPQASGSRSPGCPRCQDSHERKSPGSLSPQPLPQCKRHLKQVQLLFCEDHDEPICLICSLSQEHQGHRVRPIEEVALEHKKKIQKQLEHLKKLRKSGEEQRSYGEEKAVSFLKQTEALKQRVQRKLEQVYYFLEQQEHFFVASLEDVGQMVGQIRKAYDTRVSQDIALLDALIGELEAKECQSEWELLQVGSFVSRAKTVRVPEQWTTPQEIKQKIQLLHQKSEFVEKSTKYFSETLRSEMEMFNGESSGIQIFFAVNVILDAETAYPNLIFSDDLKSVRLGNKWERLPDGPQRFDSCIIVLGSPSFLSGCRYWEVEVGDKTAWILGACKTSISRKGNMTLSPENGYWVVIMMKENEYQASSVPPTRLLIKEPPKRVGIFVDYGVGSISFYNVTARSHIYTFASCSFSGPLQPIFSPGTRDGGKNTAPLTICPVGGQGPD